MTTLLLVLAGALVVPVPPGPSAAAAGADAAAPTAASTLVPAGARWLPRGAVVQGVGETGVLLREEPADGGWSWPSRWLTADGTSVSAPAGDDVQVLGDRLVRPRDAHPRIVETSLAGGTTVELSVPSGYGYLSATADGVLLGGPPGPGRLSLLPYEGGPVRQLADVGLQPAADAGRRRAADASGALLYEAGAGHRYVDSTGGRVTRLPDGAHSPALGPGAVAWWQDTGGGPVVASAPRVDGGLGPVVVRRLPADVTADRPSWEVTPVGGSLVLSARYDRYRTAPAPVRVVDADGAVRVVAQQGSGVVPSGESGFLLTTHSAAGTRVVEVDLSGTVTRVLADLPPVPARTRAVTLDGDRLVSIDDASPGEGVVERLLSGPAGAPAVGEPRLLAGGASSWARASCLHSGPACRNLVAGGGGTAFTRHDSIRGTSWAGLPAGGSAVVEVAAQDHGLAAVDGPWLLSGGLWGDPQRLVDLSDPALAERRPVAGDDGSVAVQDGVTSGPWAVDSRYLAQRDLATGRTALRRLPLPACATGGPGLLQVAGSWVLGEVPGCGPVAMDLADRYPARVLPDRVRPWLPPDEEDLVLGDGVVAGHAEGRVWWYDLTAPVAYPALPLTPSPLGEGAEVALTRQPGPQSVAWLAPEGLRVARLPVAAPAAPARPDGPTSVPAAPVGVAATAQDQAAAVSWSAPAAGEQVGQWTVTAAPGGASVSVTGSARRAVVPGLMNGQPYAFRVTARNLVGSSAPSAPIPATPLSPPVPPLALRVTEDPWPGTVQVSWWHPEDASARPASAFRVQVGPVTRTVGPTVDTTELLVPVRGRHVVTVTALDATGRSTSSSLPAQALGRAPRVDRIAVTGTDGQLWARSGESAYRALGGRLVGAPAVVQHSGEAWYVGVGTNGRLYVRTDRLGWAALAPLSTPCSSVSATVASSTLLVACRGADGHLWAGGAPLVAGRLPVVTALRDLGGVLLPGTGPTIVPAGGGVYAVVGADLAVWTRTPTTGWRRIAGGSTLCSGSPAISPAGAFLGCATGEGLNVRLGGERYATVPGAVTGRTGVALDPDGTARLYVTGRDGVVRVTTRTPGREPTALSIAGGRGSGGVTAVRLP